MNKNYIKFLTFSIAILGGIVINSNSCYCMQNNIVYDNHGVAIPTTDNNGKIIENGNFFFNQNYLRYSYNNIRNNQLRIMVHNNIGEQTIYMVEYCFRSFLRVAETIGFLVTNLVEYQFPDTYTNINLRNRAINIDILKNIVLSSNEKWNVNTNNVQEITLEQFMNYLCNKIYFIGIQHTYNIMEILEDNNNNIGQKENKIKKEIALCYDKILNLVNIFNNSLLNELNIALRGQLYNRDLVTDINNDLKYRFNQMKDLDNEYNLGQYRNMNI